jgi:8-oxo-dGTP diphosphatase
VTTLVVTAAVIAQQGRYLVTRRLKGTHLAGTWEFPGGKCEEGESLVDCMRRELSEELGVACEVGDEIFTVAHDYDDRRVELHFFACTIHGEPLPLLGQEMQWVERARLRELPFPPADTDLLTWLSSQTDARVESRTGARRPSR